MGVFSKVELLVRQFGQRRSSAVYPQRQTCKIGAAERLLLRSVHVQELGKKAENLRRWQPVAGERGALITIPIFTMSDRPSRPGAKRKTDAASRLLSHGSPLKYDRSAWVASLNR
jgi:hypothetical protein